jgi:hypothetical protein
MARLLSISISSPTPTSSALSPSLRWGIILILLSSLFPKPFSGGTSMLSLSPTFALDKASSNPFKTQLSPMDTILGSYLLVGS